MQKQIVAVMETITKEHVGVGSLLVGAIKKIVNRTPQKAPKNSLCLLRNPDNNLIHVIWLFLEAITFLQFGHP